MSAQDPARLYLCPDGSMFFATLGPDRATLEAFGLSWTLPLARANRFANARLALTVQGNGVTIERNGAVVFKDCSAASATASAPRRFTLPSVLEFALPASWDDDRFTTETKSSDSGDPSISFLYRPLDPALPRPALLRLDVSTRNSTYTLTLPSTNPFPPGSRDAASFQRMILTRRQVTDALTLLDEPEQFHRWRSITGSASVRNPVPLTPAAVLIVRLHTVVQDEERLIAERRILVQGPGPIAFELRYDPELIDPHARYTLSARIEDTGRLLFSTPAPLDVITGYPNRVELKLIRARSRALLCRLIRSPCR